MADEGKGGDAGDKKGAGEGTVSKEDHDKILADNKKLSEQMEELRMEVLSPEYMLFLDEREKGGDKGKSKEEDKPKKDEVSDDDFEKLSKKEIYERARKAAKEELDGEVKRLKDEASDSEKARTQKEILRFAKTHDDYEKFRPVMYGLSLDPKNEGFGLEELYTMAKEHVKRLAEPTKEEIEKQKKMKGEKPGGSSSSFEEDRKLSAEEATKKAAEEVREKLGPIPAA